MSHPSSGGPSTSTPTTRRSAAASQAAATEASQSAASAGPSSAPHPRSRSEAMERRSAQAASQASSTAGPSGSSSSSTFNAGGGSVASVSDCEALAARLLDPGSDVKTKLSIATELRESVDQFRDVDYGRYLDILLPAFTEVLRTGTPVFVKDSPEHRLRWTLLEIIRLLPFNDVLKPHSYQIMELMLFLLRVENEDNGVVCIKIVIDHNRTFKDEVEKHVADFLDLVKEMYSNLESVVQEEFGLNGEPATSPTSIEEAAKVSRPSLRSFKVLTECPIAVVLVFQTWKVIVFPYIKTMFPLVMECLTLQAEAQRAAYVEAAERGEVFVGVAEGITNRELYTDLIVAQVKTMSFLAYVLRTATDDIKKHASTMAEASIRLLRDTPPEHVASRKELLVATRHILTTDFRLMFVPQIDTMLHEKVLSGTGITSQEALRPLAYSMLADLVHHVRAELTVPQLSKIIHLYSCCLHEPTFTFSIQTMCAKLLVNLIEIICQKVDATESPKFLMAILECAIDKLVAIETIHGQLKAAHGSKSSTDKGKEVVRTNAPADSADKDNGKDKDDKDKAADKADVQPAWLMIERAKPVHAVAYATDGTEAYSRELYFLLDARYLIKTLLHGIRGILSQLRVLGAVPPNGSLLGRLFEAQTRLLGYYDPVRDQKDEKEALDLFGQILLHYDPYVFSEIWTNKMDFFMDQALLNHHVLQVPQSLLVPMPQQMAPQKAMNHIQEVSHQLVSILLNYLTKGLPQFGDQDKKRTALTLKLFKLAFMAVNAYPEHNEPVLVPHLAKLITDCFTYAAKATDSTIYYSILRALFRSIGGGRFEALYKEVLPILQEMLDTLNHLLLHAEPDKRDLFVELSLTVPVRLTNLLPHLGYLMKPLVHALRAGTELVSQGLRTLELCIDNLTAEFFDPTLGPVLRDLMAALHDLLKPVPFNHHHAHATVKILGKLGGRNRRFQQAPHLLEYNVPAIVDATMPISFDGHLRRLPILSIVQLAVKSIKGTSDYYRAQAVDFLQQSALLIADANVHGPEQELVFHQTVEGLFAATLYPETKVATTAFIRKLSRHLIGVELRSERHDSPDRDWRSNAVSFLTNSYLEAVALAVAALPSSEYRVGAELVNLVVDDIIHGHDRPDSMQTDHHPPTYAVILDNFWSKFASLCFDESWKKKLAGCTGLSVLTTKDGVAIKWIAEHQLDFLRPLFFVLKDMPTDPPRAVTFVCKTIKSIFETCNSDIELMGAQGRNKIVHMLIKELASTNSEVRQITRWCIERLAAFAGVPVRDLLAPVKNHLLNPIFDKPLRALPFQMQVGNVEAVTYVLNLSPPLPEIGDELLRMLTEAIALADADDKALIGLVAQHRLQVNMKDLRISCLGLLSAAMACTDYFVKNSQLRSRVIAVYFKHVYSTQPEIMAVAHDGLKSVLAHQQKLPKEILQSGLRPILANLADARKLSAAGLEGLARFLELLTNYFKVEIGHKLIDHFRTLREEVVAAVPPQSLKPFQDNQDIVRMSLLLNVIRLLPMTANMYLPELIPLVVEAETRLHQSVPGPFTENLARFLNRYPHESIPYLFENLRNPDTVRTFTHVIGSGWAPDIVTELSAEAKKLGEVCFLDETTDLVTPGLLLVRELVAQDAKWLVANSSVLDSLLVLWRASPSRLADAGDGRTPSVLQREPLLIVEILISFLKFEKHVPLLFDVVKIYTLHTSSDLSRVTSFLYEDIVAGSSNELRRKILSHFLGVFGDPEVGWDVKTHALRLLVNPILLVFFSEDHPTSELIDQDFLRSAHTLIWAAIVANDKFLEQGGDALKIELLRMSTLLVQHCSDALVEQRKDLIKMGWVYIKDPDSTVKQTAYLLISRFIENNECPTKIVMQVWSGLLKLPPTEGRTLVRKAIDIVAPVLPLRVSRAANAVHPPWATVVRKTCVDEGHSIPLLINVFELIVGHADLFYESRELFVPQMVQNLPRLGSVQNASPDMKKLSVDIVELVLAWEKRRTGVGAFKDDSESAKRPSDGDLPSPKRSRVDRAGTAVSTSSSGGWAPAAGLREAIVSYLVRLVSMSSEPLANRGLGKRAFDLLAELLGPTPWSPVSVKLNFFSRALSMIEHNENNLMIVANSCKTLALVAAGKPDAFFASQFGLLHKLVEKSAVGDETILHDSLRPILERMFEVASLPRASTDEAEAEDVVAFREWADGVISEGLKNGTGLKGSLFLLGCWAKTRSDKIEAFSGSLVKVLNKLVKDHISPVPHPTHPTATLPPDAQTTELVLSILELCRHRVQDLKEQRRWLLSALVQLIEKSSSVRVCRFVLEMLRGWVIEPKEQFPTHKEKAGLLLKMTCFDKKDDPKLLAEYLELIFDIYNEPSLRRTELTTRLEAAFLLGTRVADPLLREKFIDLFDQNLPPSLGARLQYVLASQSWEPLASGYWIHQALDLLLGCVDAEALLIIAQETADGAEPAEGSLASLMKGAKVGDYLGPARRLLHTDDQTAHKVWISVFKTAWATLSRSQQSDTSRHLVSLLAKEHHLNQIDMRPNVVQTLLEGVLAASPAITLPPFVVKYLGKTFDAWHTAIELMSNSLTIEPTRSDEVTRDHTRDGLAELFADLCEDDLFYGLWRRRSVYSETNAALSYEQNGMWPMAQVMYEAAQIKARTGVLPFTEPEYCLWEDHWILSAQKLQQWDILTDLARSENNHDLLLECAWRLSDWGSVDRETIETTLAAVSDVATPRRKVFEAYTCLIKAQQHPEKGPEFGKILDEAFQLSIRKWVSLPKQITMAHVPLLQLFQQYVELQEAAQVFESLAMTNAANLEFRVSHDLKGIFTTWRERLPNFWDDISVWSDLLAWRQHVFSAVTKVYVPLIPAGETATFGYRGYHETAWMINRFGHVARKHQLHDVCANALNKIYALPNIEISEAFLKLREQAMSHYQKPDKLAEGLESISTTNLMYFAAGQKAEFLTLKGMFIAKLGHDDDANQAFAAAVQQDLNLSKAWAEWGRFNDRIFRQKPLEPSYAANAVSCYLQAAGLYKNRKTRKLLVRVLWLLSLDEQTGAISRAFESYKGDSPTWYWITLVPQLLLSLSHREARHARNILMKIAKMFPQALFYQLRTTKEEFENIKKQNAHAMARYNQEREAAARAAHAAAIASAAASTDASTTSSATRSSNGGDTPSAPDAPSLPAIAAAAGEVAPPPAAPAPSMAPPAPPSQHQPNTPKQPWELVDELLNILKTGFPLLALSMEKMVDQIQTRGKSSTPEDIYRFITALLMEGIQQYIYRSDKRGDTGKITPQIKEAITRFAQNVKSQSNDVRKRFEDDFMQESNLRDYVGKLQKWRDRYETMLDRRPRKQPLDQGHCYLSEFHHGKFDEVEIPGQYLQHVDNNNDFAKIARFSPTVELGRGNGFCFRRITMLGHDGSHHTFSVQLPAARHTRREDRISQVFRTLSTVLQSRKESRKRNLSFHLPAAVPLATSLRLLELDHSYTSLQDIYDAHCREKNLSKEDPILHITDRFKNLFDPETQKVGSAEWLNLRVELHDEVETKFVPKDVLTNYMIRLMKTPSDLFLMRKQFTLQMASVTFISYVAALQQRTLPRFNISKATGLIYMSELLPSFSTIADQPPLLHNDDPVDFRLTPNIQHFMTLTGIEGILTSSLVAIGRGLCQPEFDLEEQLSLYMKDEVYHMINVLKRRPLEDMAFRNLVWQNVDVFTNKVKVMSCQYERDRAKGDTPVTQAVITLINKATNKQNLARLGEGYCSFF